MKKENKVKWCKLTDRNEMEIEFNENESRELFRVDENDFLKTWSRNVFASLGDFDFDHKILWK